MPAKDSQRGLTNTWRESTLIVVSVRTVNRESRLTSIIYTFRGIPPVLLASVAPVSSLKPFIVETTVWSQRPIGGTRLPTERVSRDLIKADFRSSFHHPSPYHSSISSFSTFSFVLFFRSVLSVLGLICSRDPSPFALFFRNGAKRGGLGTQCAADWSARLSVAYDCPYGARLLRRRFERTNVKERVSKGGRNRTASWRKKGDIQAVGE